MMQSERFSHDGILRIYEKMKYNPLAQDDFVRTHGDILHESFRNLFGDMTQDRIPVLSGYYASNVKVGVSKVQAVFREESKDVRVLLCNMLMFEIIYDLLVFEKKRDRLTFLAIFEKYISVFRGTADGSFADWLKEVKEEHYPREKDGESGPLIKLLAAMQFLVFHEFAHLEPELPETAMQMLLRNEMFLIHLSKMTRKQLLECMCDYYALFLAASRSLPVRQANENSDISYVEALEIGFLLLNADIFLNLLKSFASLGTRESDSVKEALTEAKRQLLIRSAPLVIAGVLTEKEMARDTQEAFMRAHSLIQDFFQCLSEVFSLLIGKIEEIENVQKVSVIFEKKAPVAREDIWYRIS